MIQMALTVGFSKVKITPRPGIRLGGYAHRLGKPSTMVHDDLYAKILLISGKGGELALVQLDLLGLYLKDSSEVKGIVGKALGIRPSNVIVASTHTHSAPETIIPMWPNTIPYTESERAMYNEWFRGMLKAVEDASRGVKIIDNAQLSVGSVKVEGLCFNRTFKGGPINDELTLIGISGGGLRILIASYACHPVCNTDLGISADYPGAFYRYLEDKGFEAIFLTGADGDIDPVRKGREYMSSIGLRLGEASLSAFKSLKSINQVELSLSRISVKLPTRAPPPLSQAEARFKEAYSRVTAEGGLPREPDESMWRNPSYVNLLYSDEEYELAKLGVRNVEASVNIVELGNMLIVTIPGEPFVESEFKIKKHASSLGFSRALVVGYVDDYVGYIPVRDAFRVGAYEARLARWSIVDEDAEEILVEGVLNGLRR